VINRGIDFIRFPDWPLKCTASHSVRAQKDVQGVP
jgi:hypothetical protein